MHMCTFTSDHAGTPCRETPATPAGCKQLNINAPSYLVAISTANREFIDGLIDYYISEASSYRQIAEQYVPEIESVPDAAFGVIAGCVYASFLETYRNQQIQPGLEDMTEFNMMLKERAASIKKAIVDPASVGMAASRDPPSGQEGAPDRTEGADAAMAGATAAEEGEGAETEAPAAGQGAAEDPSRAGQPA